MPNLYRREQSFWLVRPLVWAVGGKSLPKTAHSAYRSTRVGIHFSEQKHTDDKETFILCPAGY
jgi:hypothetical protein